MRLSAPGAKKRDEPGHPDLSLAPGDAGQSRSCLGVLAPAHPAASDRKYKPAGGDPHDVRRGRGAITGARGRCRGGRRLAPVQCQTAELSASSDVADAWPGPGWTIPVGPTSAAEVNLMPRLPVGNVSVERWRIGRCAVHDLESKDESHPVPSVSVWGRTADGDYIVLTSSERTLAPCDS